MIEWNPKITIVGKLINVLYGLDGCEEGGLLHFVIEDGNIKDDDIEYALHNCENNPDEIDSELGIIICCYLSQLTLKQRALLLSLSSSYITKELWESLQDDPIVQYKFKSYLGISIGE